MKNEGRMTAAQLIVTLQLAFAVSDFSHCKKLIQQGTYVDARDEHGNSPFMAITPDAKDNKIARLLLKAGAAVNGTNRNGETPLFVAAASGNAVLVKEVLKARADQNLKARKRRQSWQLTDPQFAAAFEWARIRSSRNSVERPMSLHMMKRMAVANSYPQ
jgi:ankyrin repeat protein